MASTLLFIREVVAVPLSHAVLLVRTCCPPKLSFGGVDRLMPLGTINSKRDAIEEKELRSSIDACFLRDSVSGWNRLSRVISQDFVTRWHGMPQRRSEGATLMDGPETDAGITIRYDNFRPYFGPV